MRCEIFVKGENTMKLNEKLNEISKKFRSGEISEEEALKTLEITRSTFYRRLRELKL